MVVLKFGVFPHCYSVFCAVCIQAMTHSAAYVPSQQAVELVSYRSWLTYWRNVGFDFFGRPVATKSGVIGEMALQSVTLTLTLSYFPD